MPTVPRAKLNIIPGLRRSTDAGSCNLRGQSRHIRRRSCLGAGASSLSAKSLRKAFRRSLMAGILLRMARWAARIMKKWPQSAGAAFHARSAHLWRGGRRCTKARFQRKNLATNGLA